MLNSRIYSHIGYYLAKLQNIYKLKNNNINDLHWTITKLPNFSELFFEQVNLQKRTLQYWYNFSYRNSLAFRVFE